MILYSPNHCKYAFYSAQIRDLQGKIVEQEFEHRKYVDLNNRLQATLDTQRRTNKKAEIDRVTEIKEKDNKLRTLTLTNDELDMDIEDAITNIEKWYVLYLYTAHKI